MNLKYSYSVFNYGMAYEHVNVRHVQTVMLAKTEVNTAFSKPTDFSDYLIKFWGFSPSPRCAWQLLRSCLSHVSVCV